MGNTQNKKDVQVRLDDANCEPKPLMLLKFELLREFNFTPKLIDYQYEAKKLRDLEKMDAFPEDRHPHILLSDCIDAHPYLTQIFHGRPDKLQQETGNSFWKQNHYQDQMHQENQQKMLRYYMNENAGAGQQKNLRANHQMEIENVKYSILQRMQYVDPYDPYAHIKEFQKMHTYRSYLTPTNYNHGMNDDDLLIHSQDKGYFTRNQEHYFSIFVTYRFLYSHRQWLTDHDFWDLYCRDQWERERQKKMKLLAELQKYQRFDSKTFALHQELQKEQTNLEDSQRRLKRNMGRRKTMYFNVPPKVEQNILKKNPQTQINMSIVPKPQDQYMDNQLNQRMQSIKESLGLPKQNIQVAQVGK